MSASLVGSEMCIRDREPRCLGLDAREVLHATRRTPLGPDYKCNSTSTTCLLYTSDAADDM
eukprot:7797739-Alexandrium_andersonii.AAC.1